MLINYSHYSVLQSILKPKDIVNAAVDFGSDSVGICDINTMAGIVQFVKAANNAGVKPIIGCTFLDSEEGKIAIFAQNKTGYLNLLKLFSTVNSKSYFFRFPILTFKTLEESNLEGLIAVTGYQDSSYHNLLLDNENYQAYFDKLKSIFGEKLFLVSDSNEVESNIKLSQSCYRNNKNSEYLYDIVLATRDKCTIPQLSTTNSRVFNSHDISFIADMCEEYNILSVPKLPHFDCPDNLSPIEYLKKLCWEGFKSKIVDNKEKYLERFKYEVGVFEKANLAEYFLVLEDIIKFCRSNKYMTGCGRGSAAGCLVSYLLSITKVDPIKYNLLFSRFFNEGRLGSLPDIDSDFPKHARAHIIDYVINKYGENRTGQIVTYQTMMGRAALKSVFRAEGKLSFAEMSEITQHLEDKAKIADELQAMKEAGRDPSIIMWALENKPHKFTEWAKLNEGKLEGPLANQFEYAIQLEGIKSASSRHPCGFIVSNDPLESYIPMMYDETSEKQIVGLEYEDAEQMGCAKFDFLSLSSLDRLEDIASS